MPQLNSMFIQLSSIQNDIETLRHSWILGWANGAQAADVDGAWWLWRLCALHPADVVGARRLFALLADWAGSRVLAVGVGNTWRLWTLWVSSGPGSSCVSLEVVAVHCVVASTVKHLILTWWFPRSLMFLQMHCILNVNYNAACVIRQCFNI